ncbi:hypothetical protein AXE80_10910 [Wenyingzhuangia fucanilytica]|uniref:Integrase n=1 Tax=Wenyingzhuangia fucanilytica TaxID=1790137 RepID=A0A1B1Y7P3_9FLAO|nr:site-specific integrase [Wenyingzhuangia fucanilytica]ANW96754.1 hypothetical protein AXE80_10910 [Wenyingzhuangia fucanilytica]
MYTSQKQHTQVNIDYIPAELHENKIWEIQYYVLNPFTEKLERKRNRVKPLKSITLRRQLAKQMIVKINARLAKGWNPFLERKGLKELTKLYEVFEIYLKNISIEYKDGNKSLDTYKTYNSRIKNLKIWLEENRLQDLYCYKFDYELIDSFLDYLRYDKEVSARTRDNYMTFITTLSLWMMSKKYLAHNPCEGFKKINKKTEASRCVFPQGIREQVLEFWKEHNINYFVLCMTCYYCLVRRTELTKIRVRDLNLNKQTLFVEAENAKNNRTAHVSVPKELVCFLANHVKKAKSTDFIFSADNFKPGTNQLNPNTITNKWSVMRKKIDIDTKYKWYGLKDSGITDLIIKGVNLKSVRDQARHHSIKQTEEYIPRNMKEADINILNSGVSFMD